MIKYFKYIYPKFEWSIITTLSKEQIYNLVKRYTKIDDELNKQKDKKNKEFYGKIDLDGFILSRNPKGTYRGIAQPIICGSFIQTSEGTKLTAIFKISWNSWLSSLIIMLVIAILPIYFFAKSEEFKEFSDILIYWFLPILIAWSYVNFWYETLCGVSAFKAYLKEYRI